MSSQPRQMEIVPYVTTRSKLERARPGDPYHSNNEMTYRAGGDLKVNLTTNLTLDATVNPDFGQVEVDPAVVNLSVFETTFSEKRPFFVSNSGYFSTGGFSCFFCSNVSSLSLIYTRRIGRSPQLAGLVSGESDFMDASDATTILGAGKVTGRTSNGITVGVLDAVTNRETATFRPIGSTADETREIEPLTNYFIGRLRKDFRGGATRVGAITTMVNRRLTNPEEVERLRSNAQVVGLDLDHHWANRRLRVEHPDGSYPYRRRHRRHSPSPDVEREVLPAARSNRDQRRTLFYRLRSDPPQSVRVRFLRPALQGHRQLAVGGNPELAQPGLRGQRSRRPWPR